MTNNFYFVVIIFAGIIDLYFSIRFLIDSKFAEDSLHKNPKSFIWKKIFGEEKAMFVLRRIFSPIGILLGIFLILGGLYFLLFV